MKEKKKITFTVKLPVESEDFDNKETRDVSLDVRVPNLAQTNEAQFAYNRAMDAAIRSKAPFRIEVERTLKERGLWTDIKQDELDKLNKELSVMVNKLHKGGMKLSTARQLAIDIRNKRIEISNLTADRRILDSATAESQAEIARFNWFVTNCTVYSDTGNPFFVNEEGKADIEAYLRVANTDYAQTCARNFGVLQYGLDADFDRKLPENVFLLKYKFVRESDLHLINEDGKLIDQKGNLVDEKGFLVDTDGHQIDYTGTPLDKEGNPLVPAAPFYDEEGQPVD